jgi:uncharacterized caspase-like protein
MLIEAHLEQSRARAISPEKGAWKVKAWGTSLLCLGLLLLSALSRADITVRFTSVKLWDARTGKEIELKASPAEHKGTVSAVAFSPDSRILASASEDHTIKLRDAATGKELENLTGQSGHANIVNAIAFSPDGRFLASAGEDRTIKLWELNSKNDPLTIKGHQGGVKSIAFTHDSKVLASGSADKTIKLWSVDTGNEIGPALTGHVSGVTSVAFSQDDKILASGSYDKTIRLWNTVTHHPLRALNEHAAAVTSLAFSPDGKSLASGSDDDTLKLWNISSANNISSLTLNGHVGPITAVAFNNNGTTVASGSWDGTVKFWNAQDGQIERTIRAHDYRVTSVAYSADGRYFASSTILMTEPAPPTLFILAIGCNKYRSPLSVLSYADVDAQKFAAEVEQGCKGVFQRIAKQTLLGSHASLAEIRAALDAIAAEAKPQDTFIFYFAGHSRISEPQSARPECYLLPADTLALKDETVMASESFSASRFKEWLNALQAQKQLIVLNSPEQADVFDVFATRIVGAESHLTQLTQRDVVVLGADGIISEIAKPEPNNPSPFTASLLKGMAEEKPRAPGGVLITARKLESYLFRHLSNLSNEQQIPRVKRIGSDFPLAAMQSDAGGSLVTRAPADTQKPKINRQGKYYALLIADSHYNDPGWRTLPNPILDAKALGEALERIYGFEKPEIVLDQTFDELYDLLLKYKDKKFAENDALLVFFAGHGDFDEDTGEGCIVTRNSKLDDRAKKEYLHYSVLRALADRIPCKHILIILDVCYGGTFNPEVAKSALYDSGPDEASVEEYIYRKMQFPTREYLASTGNAYAFDGEPERHSPFTRKLLEALESYGSPYGVLTLGRIKQYVDLLKNQPFAGSFGNHHPGGEFILIIK